MKYLKFWRPESGLFGGMLMGFVIVFFAMLVMPPIVALSKWWLSVFGL